MEQMINFLRLAVSETRGEAADSLGPFSRGANGSAGRRHSGLQRSAGALGSRPNGGRRPRSLIPSHQRGRRGKPERPSLPRVLGPAGLRRHGDAGSLEPLPCPATRFRCVGAF